MKHKYQWAVFPAVLVLVLIVFAVVDTFAPKKVVPQRSVAATASPEPKPKPKPAPKPISKPELPPEKPKPEKVDPVVNIEVPVSPDDVDNIDEERTWQYSDGSMLVGVLDGVTANLQTAFISGKKSGARAEIEKLVERDQAFCKRMLSRYGKEIVFDPGLDLSKYGKGFDELTAALIDYAESVTGISPGATSAQQTTLSQAAHERFFFKITGVELRFPIVVTDANVLAQQGKKLNVRLSAKCVYSEVPFAYAHAAWMTERESFSHNKGDVWWMSTRVGEASKEDIGALRMAIDPFAFLPCLESERAERSTSGMQIPLAVQSISKAGEQEALELLNVHGWGKSK